jgi:hypothetical protein
LEDLDDVRELRQFLAPAAVSINSRNE